MCKDGVWGSITSSSWNNRAARVVCRQLGLPWECKFWSFDIYMNGQMQPHGINIGFA